MLRICLTGGIASGKSLVSEMFASLGVPIADSDVAARAIVEPGSPGLEAVVSAFGEDMLARDGSLDRRSLRARIFSDDEARKRLESILHPLIREHVEEQLQDFANKGHAYAIRVVPLLVETESHSGCDRVVVIDAPERVQIARLIARDGGSEDDARAILARQASRWQRLKVATDVVDNGDSIAPSTGIRAQVMALDRKFRELAHKRLV